VSGLAAGTQPHERAVPLFHDRRRAARMGAGGKASRIASWPLGSDFWLRARPGCPARTFFHVPQSVKDDVGNVIVGEGVFDRSRMAMGDHQS
jgi:hypothetical protein